MSLLDNLRDKLLGVEPEEYYDDEYYDDETRQPHHKSLLGNDSRAAVDSVSVYRRSGERVAASSRSHEVYEETAQVDYSVPASVKRSTTRLATESVGAPQTRASRTSIGQLPAYVLRPGSYEDVQLLLRRVRTNQPVVLSFKGTDVKTASRVLDFAFGLACGIDGSVEELGDRVFAVLPQGCELSSQDTMKLRRDGVF